MSCERYRRAFAPRFAMQSRPTFDSSPPSSVVAESSVSGASIGPNSDSGSAKSGCSMTSQRVQLRSSPSSPKPKRTLGSRRKARESQSVALAKVKDDLSHYLRLAANQEIVITRHGRPAGILIGFDSEEAWFEYRLEHHPEFLARVQNARASLRAGGGVRLEDIPA